MKQKELLDIRRPLLFSLEKETVDNILSREKRIEFRKIYPNCKTRAFVYTKGLKRVLIALDLKAPCSDMEEIKSVGGHGSDDFINGKKKAKNALIIEKVWKVQNQLTLEQLKELNTPAPQSYIYLDNRPILLKKLSENLEEYL